MAGPLSSRSWPQVGALLLAAIALAPLPSRAEDGPDISGALEVPKKPRWDPKGKAIDPFGRGDAKRKQEAWGDAIPLLVAALDAQPGCGKCLSSLARALEGSGRYEDAVRVGELLNQIYPERKDGWQRISDAWLAAQHERDCVDATSKYLEHEKADSGMWWRRNKLLLQLGAFDEANELLDGAEAAGLSAHDVACLRVQLLSASNDPAGARETWGKCDEGDNLDLKRYSEGWLALAEGEPELAVKRLTMAGADDFARVTIAYLRLDQDKPDLALNMLGKVAPEAGWADVHLARALALHALERDEEALAEIRDRTLAEGGEALTTEDVLLKPKGAGWPAEVGRRGSVLAIELMAAAGDADGAQAAYDKAVAVYGESDDLKAALPAAPEEKAKP